jgi:hypothetical protein
MQGINRSESKKDSDFSRSLGEFDSNNISKWAHWQISDDIFLIWGHYFDKLRRYFVGA